MYNQKVLYKSYFINGETKETQKIRQNPEKGGREYLRRILDA